MTAPRDPEVERVRQAFFERTRTPVAVLYVALGAMAVGCAVSSARQDAAKGAIGLFALIRRRLARDDDLLIEAQKRGFDPEKPWGWMRRGS